MSASTLFLMYHAVLGKGEDAHALGRGDLAYAVRYPEWCGQLDRLRAAEDFHPAAPPAGPEARGGHRRGHGFLLTFDDSWRQHLHVTAPELLSRKLPAIFFITTGQVAGRGMLLWNEVRELARLGFTIGSHGKTHRFLTELRTAALREELHHAKRELEDGVSRPVHLLSLPGGRYNERVLAAAAEAGFTHVFTSDPGLWQEGPLVPRVAVRAGPRGTRTVEALLADPFAAAGRLARRAALLRACRRLLGERVYHWLHGRLA